MRRSWLYLAIRSLREAEPVLICPVFRATARSAIVLSSVSPLRWDITDPHHTLGDQPTDALQRADYLQTALTVTRHLREIEQAHQIDQHLEIDGPELGLNIGLSR